MLMHSLSKSPIECPLSWLSMRSETTGSWCTPCESMILSAARSVMWGVVVHTWHLIPSKWKISDTNIYLPYINCNLITGGYNIRRTLYVRKAIQIMFLYMWRMMQIQFYHLTTPKRVATKSKAHITDQHSNKRLEHCILRLGLSE